MLASLQSLIGNWWTRFWGLGSPVRNSSQAPTYPPVGTESPETQETIAVEQVVATDTGRVDAESVREALAETLMLSVEGATTKAAKVSALNQDILREETLKTLSGLRQIPSLHSLARGFSITASRDGVSIDEVVGAIGKDPALCVRVLRMANSAYVSSAQRIDDLPSAVHMLGVVRIRSLVQALYTLRDSRSIAPGFDWRHLWLHALATASISEEIERELGLNTGPVLYLSALLHDVGKIVLSVIDPDAYRDILLATWQGSRPLEETERAHFGLTHREAGEIYLRQNNLGDAVIATAAHHNSPGDAPEEYRLVASIVALSNYACKAYGLGFSGAVLTEEDGDFEHLPAWRVIAASTGRAPNVSAVEEKLKICIPTVKAELLKMRAGA